MITSETHGAFHNRILEMLAGGSSLLQTQEAIVSGIEKMHSEMLCSILLVDSAGKRLRNSVATSLPDFYNAATDGIEIAIGSGSCGTAAFTGERVMVDDIATHPYWTNYKEAALRAGLSACWSQPIHSSSGQILGTFAIYHRGTNKPENENIELIEQSARLVSIALEKNRAEEELRESKAFVQSVLDSVANQIAVINEAGIIISINDAWRKFSIDNSNEPGQMAPNTDVGTNYFEICGGMSDNDSDAVSAREGIQAVLEGRIPTYSLEYPCHSPKQQRWFIMTVTPLKTGNKGAVIVHNDISQRKQSEQQIQKLAFYDPLTNLANRRLLLDRLRQAVAESKRSGHFCAVIFLDLDNFKPLNDDYGHDMGDVLLIDAARRLQHCVRETDTVARFGGDEFVIMLPQISADKEHAESQARSIAEKIRSTLSAPYQLALETDDIIIGHQCTVSIGVTLFNGQETDNDEVIKRADAAMYKAKQSGRNAIEYATQHSKPNGLAEAIPGNFVQLNWRSAYLSGNPVIDQQHRGLIDSANQLLTLLLEDHTSTEVATQIDTLLRDVAQHFHDEEAIITAAGYPEASDHAAIHRELLEKAAKLVAGFHAGTLGIGELFEFLAHDVVARHILRSDREFFPLFY